MTDSFGRSMPIYEGEAGDPRNRHNPSNPPDTYDAKVESSRFNSPHDLVREWHHSFNIPVGNFDQPWWPNPTPGSDAEERLHFRMELIREEMDELEKAVADPNGPVLRYQHLDPSLVETVDALGDLVYVIYGMAIEMGVNLDAVLEEIQRSNMSKLGTDGKPIYREDGKVLKGPNFSPPDFRRIIGDV